MSRLKLKQIQEILIASIQNGDFLAYNSTTGKWENNSAPIDGAKGAKGTTGSKNKADYAKEARDKRVAELKAKANKQK